MMSVPEPIHYPSPAHISRMSLGRRGSRSASGYTDQHMIEVIKSVYDHHKIKKGIGEIYRRLDSLCEYVENLLDGLGEHEDLRV